MASVVLLKVGPGFASTTEFYAASINYATLASLTIPPS
jgi:hypothetical protein